MYNKKHCNVIIFLFFSIYLFVDIFLFNRLWRPFIYGFFYAHGSKIDLLHLAGLAALAHSFLIIIVGVIILFLALVRFSKIPHVVKNVFLIYLLSSLIFYCLVAYYFFFKGDNWTNIPCLLHTLPIILFTIFLLYRILMVKTLNFK